MHITLIVGARPNFMKVAPIIREIQNTKAISYALVHTGQHYDGKLSHQFFTELGLPKPDINLEVGSGSQAEQTGRIMIAFEAYLQEHPTDLVLVVGDVNSTMAATLVAKKKHIKVAHLEAGIRSKDLTMPEEINRIVTDSICDYYFTTSTLATENLLKEGISNNNIWFVGNTMIDTLMYHKEQFLQNNYFKELGLETGAYLVLTLHRPSNVDDLESIINIFKVIEEESKGLPVVFPMHPRTKKSLGENYSFPKNFILLEPEGYLNFMNLVAHGKGVITDSGGIQEETTLLGIPCLTLRENTERPETIFVGTNTLVGTNPEKLRIALIDLLQNAFVAKGVPEKWDGKTAKRIVNQLTALWH
jgi:UDP-N-acetylglucosamine 2-epimerase (non-hydrolysing)